MSYVLFAILVVLIIAAVKDVFGQMDHESKIVEIILRKSVPEKSPKVIKQLHSMQEALSYVGQEKDNDYDWQIEFELPNGEHIKLKRAADSYAWKLL